MTYKYAFNASALSLLAISLLGGTAHAATETATIAVTATVAATCTLTATPLAFPAYTGAADVTATADLTVTCSNTAPYVVSLDMGNGTGATAEARLMTGGVSGTDTLTYQLFQTNAQGIAWGNTPGTDTLDGTGDGAAQTLTVYGLIAASQESSIGDYSDSVVASIDY
ncbi:Csu type fimbrial protein [Phytopseudomonas dryadis]|uniref:Spore coat protein n=1 Tax=Phytopseudomonas dryadis TaxID=2487520 RepID=A0A4Q9R8U6_9GAMM|nr:spore coat protein U domain-containing protein [Pseudomonas dryadis]TBU96151.1 spore coat protein [Pseudomonas dryadis]